MKVDYKDDIVVAGALRTPIGQVNKSLAKFLSYQLGNMVAEELINRVNLPKDKIDAVIAAEIGQSSKAPNVARVMSVSLDLPLEIPALTVANNCVSSFEAIVEAARRILLGEQELLLVIGVESMSNFPMYLNDARKDSRTSTPEKIYQTIKNNPEIFETELKEKGIVFIDSVFEGLTDPARGIMMIETAEIVSQNYGFTKEQLDEFAYKSYKNAYEALVNGKYDKYMMKIDLGDGKVLDKDEYIMSKKSFVSKPERFAKASPIYDIKEFYEKFGKWIKRPYKEGETKPTISLFNSCPQSDGAGAVVITTRKKAEELGLPILAKLVSWHMYGVDPAYMGIGMAYALRGALQDAGLSIDDMAKIEFHEAFAATVMGTMHELTHNLGIDVLSRYEKGDVNPNGGSLSLGHPLGATGIRVLINMIMDLDENPDAKYIAGAICAGGGVAGSLIIERP